MTANSRAVNRILDTIREEIREEYQTELLRLHAALGDARASNRSHEDAFLRRIDEKVAGVPSDAPFYGDELRRSWSAIRPLAEKERSE